MYYYALDIFYSMSCMLYLYSSQVLTATWSAGLSHAVSSHSLWVIGLDIFVGDCFGPNAYYSTGADVSWYGRGEPLSIHSHQGQH